MGHACALMANASLLGLLIPPNATLIIFAWISGISVLSCFLSTVGPGFVTIALLSIINVWMLRNNKEVFVEVKRTGKERMDMFMKRGRLAIPALVMPFMVLGGIYGGVMTTTEASALAVFYCIPIGLTSTRDSHGEALQHRSRKRHHDGRHHGHALLRLDALAPLHP